jgi:TonB family protein
MVALEGDVSLAKNRPAWIEVRSPNFIVVTNANEREASLVANQFEIIRTVFLDYFGDVSVEDQPVTILAARDEDTFKHLLPDAWTQKGSALRAGFFQGGSDKNYVALRVDASLNKDAYEPFEPIYHEYFHFLTRKMMTQLPLWVVEGTAEFFGNTRIETSKVFLGAPSISALVVLRDKPLLPLSSLFDIDAASPYYNEKNKTSIFYAESWALTHYLIVRDWREKTHRLNDFTALLHQHVPQAEAARRTVGDPASLEQALKGYIHNATFLSDVRNPPRIEQAQFQVRVLSEAESLAVRADLIAHTQRYEEARQMLEESVKLDPKLSAACESMGFLYLQQGNTAQAEKWSAQAAALNPQSYRANYYYARSLLQGGHLDEASAAKAEASLRAALNGNPEFAPAYDVLAYVLTLPGSHQKLDEAYTMTLGAVRREPGNVQYRIRAVEVLERMGHAEAAIQVATQAAAIAKTPEERTAASAALTGAQQFQASQQKIKELHEVQKSGGVDGTAAGAVAGAGPGESAGQIPAGGSLPGANVFVKASAKIELLSDTQGVDFGPYVTKEVLPKLQVALSRLASTVAQPSVAKKKGKTVIEFAIQKDGSVVEMKLRESSNDATLDKVALDGLKAATPFQALPVQFKGKSVALRFNLSYSSVGADEQQ